MLSGFQAGTIGLEAQGIVAVSRQEGAQTLAVFTIDVLHRKSQTSSFYVLKVGVKLEFLAVVSLDAQGEGFVVLRIPKVRLIGRNAGHREIYQFLVPYAATLMHLNGKPDYCSGKLAMFAGGVTHSMGYLYRLICPLKHTHRWEQIASASHLSLR